MRFFFFSVFIGLFLVSTGANLKTIKYPKTKITIPINTTSSKFIFAKKLLFIKKPIHIEIIMPNKVHTLEDSECAPPEYFLSMLAVNKNIKASKAILNTNPSISTEIIDINVCIRA